MEHWWEWWRKVLVGRYASQVDRGAGCDLVPGSTCSNLTFLSALPAWILGISMFSLFFVCRLFYQSQSHLHPFSPWPPSSHLPVPPCIKDFLSWAAKKIGFHSLLVPFFTSMNECQGRKRGGSTWFPSVTDRTQVLASLWRKRDSVIFREISGCDPGSIPWSLPDFCDRLCPQFHLFKPSHLLTCFQVRTFW